MTIEQVFGDKTIKAKGKVSTLGEWLINNQLPMEELLAFADKQKATDKATFIEAIEYATKKAPAIADENVLAYVTKALKEDEPRVKWESAKVIGNIAKLFPAQLSQPTKYLLANAENNGTVVRWATAYALGEIVKLKTELNKTLLSKLDTLYHKEEDNGVKEKYFDAIKKSKV